MWLCDYLRSFLSSSWGAIVSPLSSRSSSFQRMLAADHLVTLARLNRVQRAARKTKGMRVRCSAEAVGLLVPRPGGRADRQPLVVQGNQQAVAERLLVERRLLLARPVQLARGAHLDPMQALTAYALRARAATMIVVSGLRMRRAATPTCTPSWSGIPGATAVTMP